MTTRHPQNDHQRRLLELLEQQGPTLHRLMLRITLNHQTADDLMQELFVRIARIDPSTHIENLSAYARRAAMNLAFDWRRRRKRHPVTADTLAEHQSHEPSPLDKLAMKEQIERLIDALARLPHERRCAVTMRFIEGRPYEDIASSLNKTIHSTRTTCSRGLKQLRKILTTLQTPIHLNVA